MTCFECSEIFRKTGVFTKRCKLKFYAKVFIKIGQHQIYTFENK